MQNTEKIKLLSDVEIGGIMRVGTEDDDVEALNVESDEVDGDLEVAIEE